MNSEQTILNLNFEKIPELKLIRDVSKHLKQGHRWVFADCFDTKEKLNEGLYLLKIKNEILGIGIVQPDTQLRFRMLVLSDWHNFKINNLKFTLNSWANFQLKNAFSIREGVDLKTTDSFRLINGEGDGLPGLVIDIYNDTAVIKFDQIVFEELWNHKALADLLQFNFPFIKTIYLKRKNNLENKGEAIVGKLKEEVIFKENNCLFASNIKDAAKTGFFLDQRDNRKLVGTFAKNKKVLNLFSYTGGFSVFAAIGGASHVTSVDISKAAIRSASRNFELNNLKSNHTEVAMDAFLFIDEKIASKEKWDLVIADPPSFAPNEKSIESAEEAYVKIFSKSLKLVTTNGYFAASSCSSHITHKKFLEICQKAFSSVRKKGTIVYNGGQPFDHPYPMAMEELRYLKFVLFRID